MSHGSETQAAPGPRVLQVVEDALLYIAAIAILLLCAIIFSGVITRAVFSWSLPDSEILVRDLMIVAIILPLAKVTADRTHIAVDVFVNLLPDWFRPISAFLGSLIGFLVVIPIAYGGWKGFHAEWGSGNYYDGDLELAVWPGKSAFFLGYATFVLRLFTLVVIDFIALFRPSSDVEPAQDKG